MDINNLSKKYKILIGVIILIVTAGVYYASISSKSSDVFDSVAEEVEEAADEKAETFFVEITGQVNSPGVYELDRKILVIELINLAGGLKDSADLQIVHKDIVLSKYVEPFQKIYIPGNFENNKSNSSTSVGNSLISINNASVEELDSLPGVGPVTAEKIISARPFSSLEDIKNVDGIGESLYNKIISQITL